MSRSEPSEDPRFGKNRGAWDREVCEAWEQASLLPMDRQRQEVRDVRLDGEYPETRITVEWRDRYHGGEYTDSWPLWSVFFRAGDGGPEMPNQVALFVDSWLSEHQPRPPGE